MTAAAAGVRRIGPVTAAAQDSESAASGPPLGLLT